MKIRRRDFVIKSSVFFFSAMPLIAKNIHSLRTAKTSQNSPGKNILLLIHLAGGNDWYNTVIPYSSQAYYRQRPSLAIEANKVLKLDQNYGLHPKLRQLKSLYDEDKLAVILNYSQAESLSHHRANLLRHAVANDEGGSWQEIYAQKASTNPGLFYPVINIEPVFLERRQKMFISSLHCKSRFALNLDSHYRLCEAKVTSLLGEKALDQLGFDDFARAEPAELSGSRVGKDALTEAMSFVAEMIKENAAATVYSISLGGFDTHLDQASKHDYLLESLDRALSLLQSEINKGGLADRLLTIVCSEFGRTLKENLSAGTDHARINHLLAFGGSVNGGIMSQAKSLKINNRQIYSSSLQNIALAWLS